MLSLRRSYMSGNNDDHIQEIIRELHALNIRQADLLDQLNTYRQDPTRATTRQATRQQAERILEPTPPHTITTQFHIGDKVRILNLRPLQPSAGKIIKIGPTRITIQTASGNTIIRAPKNIVHQR